MRDARGVLADKNQAAAREFLAHNGTLAGIGTACSPKGAPHGKPPAPTDTVTVRHRASLVDSMEFHRSESHDRPATGRVNTVFASRHEAFQSMTPGAKWQRLVPPELGYGANSPPAVPPGSLLVYELERLLIEPAATNVRSTPRPKQPAPASAH